MSNEAEYREALLLIYYNLMRNNPLLPVKASFANELADFAYSVANGMSIKEFADNKEKEKIQFSED